MCYFIVILISFYILEDIFIFILLEFIIFVVFLRAFCFALLFRRFVESFAVCAFINIDRCLSWLERIPCKTQVVNKYVYE